ncbi:YceI family protein [Hymenobacter sp. BT770]|uniref:YceI family protein n=1 Tax=Hymenobacter sp. BT770 TaxID=2886942 RepID=UPI001D12BED5|nr:YceI family protein [Hymenobacter sp. BT770]MCC3153926.1 YceI family protein [Hymenobacter sp. BT770]MDO3416144.1 YceI family protein [Hymenobacter sp. BT770]
MKKFLLPALFAVAVIGGAPAASAQKINSAKMATNAPAYKLQPQLSTLGWDGKAVTHGHNGTMQFADGDLLVKGNAIVGGTVTVDMKTMKATDITDAENQAKFVGHMSSDDFFGVATYPTSTFKIVSVAPIKGAAKDANNATITGDMTIKGVTQRLSFPAKVGVKDGVAAATGKMTIDRTKFGLKYGSKSFFESIGDKAIYDTFDLTFNVIAKKA